MSSTHRALIFDDFKGPLEVRQLPIPEPQDDEILVKINYSGICHSDLHAWNGDFDYATIHPLIGGHEGAGVVVKTEYVTARAMDAIRIPKDLNLAAAAPVLCGGVTAYKALKETNVKPGQIVAITGAGGGLGSFGIQYAGAMGMRVIAIDHSEKKDHCMNLGAEWFVDAFNTENLSDHIKNITNGGPHGIINFAAAKKPMEQAFEYIRKRGTIVLVGFPKDSKIMFDTTPLIFNAITVKGSIIGSRLDTEEALEFVARGAVKVPLEMVKLEDVSKVYRKMEDGKINSRVVVDFSL
ncbi:Protein CBG23238 [Caenorhabditis briggsae]|uniref:alcohol dehydrogenase n=1 Tax=Caenorhabditis briggsae TaxID=6238 RepID=A8Y4E0_CAEBR|nr:Protein CBG23238 [Caenorhabditis briggsae]CAP39760.1 Protein CBG23238 [Caenorhabditis briggsae]